jgi:integrase
MRKVWTSTRKSAPGKYVEWYDEYGRRRSKYFSLQHFIFLRKFKHRKFMELNSECSEPGAKVDVGWGEAVTLYINSRKTSLERKSIINIQQSLSAIQRVTGVLSTSEIDLPLYDKLQSEWVGAKSTLNLAIVHLNTFVKFLAARRYCRLIRFVPVPVVRTRRKAPGSADVMRLLEKARPAERVRIRLAMCTGLRSSDIDGILPESLEGHILTLYADKTGKPFKVRLPEGLLEKKDLPLPKLHHARWKRLCASAGVTCQFHDLRRACAQMLAEKGVTIPEIADLLQHSSMATTRNHYLVENPEQSSRLVELLYAQLHPAT